MTTISPVESKVVIETESSRLEDVQRRHAVMDNNLLNFLENQKIGMLKDDLVDLIMSAKDFAELIDLIRAKYGETASSQVKSTVEHIPPARSDLNELRTTLGQPPFSFEQLEQTEADRESNIAASPRAAGHRRPGGGGSRQQNSRV